VEDLTFTDIAGVMLAFFHLGIAGAPNSKHAKDRQKALRYIDHGVERNIEGRRVDTDTVRYSH
jgi:hypothetical protein